MQWASWRWTCFEMRPHSPSVVPRTAAGTGSWTPWHYYAALLPRRGPHIASHSVCLSVCLSVCPSVPLSLPSVTCRHLANYNDTRAEGRISYGHLGRTNLLYMKRLRWRCHSKLLQGRRTKLKYLNTTNCKNGQTDGSAETVSRTAGTSCSWAIKI